MHGYCIRTCTRACACAMRTRACMNTRMLARTLARARQHIISTTYYYITYNISYDLIDNAQDPHISKRWIMLWKTPIGPHIGHHALTALSGLR